MKKSICKSSLSKTVCLGFAFGVLMLLTACTSLLVNNECNPRLSWQKFFGYISDGDYSAAFEMTGNSFSDEVTSNSDLELDNVFMQKLSECFDYEFVSDTDVMGVTAWQTVKITNLDMRKLAEKAVNLAVEDAKTYAYKNGSYKTDEEILAAVRNNLIELLPNVDEDCLTTVSLRVKFCYRKGDWSPVIDDELYDIISGYSKHVDEAISEYLENASI